jgi:predicted dehydrogenase
LSVPWGIIGGGFGMYGYLPAIASLPNPKIIILDKSLKFIQSREELNPYLSLLDIKTTASLVDLLEQASSLVIAVPPKVQEELLIRIEKSKIHRLKFLLLEKPVASTPKRAIYALNRAISISDSVRIGYSFLNTGWAKNIRTINFSKNAVNFSITWNFMAHHINFSDSWKGSHQSGGGALRFYGIQLIAFARSLGAIEIKESVLLFDQSRRPVKWRIVFLIDNLSELRIRLDCKNISESFQILFEEEYSAKSVHINDPFSNENSTIQGIDKRVPILSEILESFASSNEYFYKLYREINELWMKIEKTTKILNLGE